MDIFSEIRAFSSRSKKSGNEEMFGVVVGCNENIGKYAATPGWAQQVNSLWRKFLRKKEMFLRLPKTFFSPLISKSTLRRRRIRLRPILLKNLFSSSILFCLAQNCLFVSSDRSSLRYGVLLYMIPTPLF